jgi:serine protease AprX
MAQQRQPRKVSSLLKEAAKAAADVAIDGREEAALALASTVRGLALGPDVSRIQWDRPLNRGRYGLKTTADIKRLKKNLSRLLPHAADLVAEAPIKPENTPAAIADLVAAAKRAAKPVAQVTYGVPSIFVKSDFAEARSRVANVLGKNFADKVSDRFVSRAGMRMKTQPAADISSDTVALVLEFQDGYEPVPETASPFGEAPIFAAARESGGEATRFLEAALRGREVEDLRARFFSRISTMRADLERRIAPALVASSLAMPARESFSALPPSSPTEVCWLNGTMQVLSAPREVAFCADDTSVQRIGLPRFLEREMNVTMATIGVLAFRAANPALDGIGIQVAVIDGECDASHPALAGRIVHKNNFTKEPWGAPDPHGTTVAGIVCSSAAGLAGVCPAATILNYKVFTTNAGLQGTDFMAAQAIQSALEDGARVANLSWGLGRGTDGTSREARAVNRAWRLGMVLVKSAGNRGPNAGSMTSPADAQDVIVVGATNRAGTAVEPYSARGPNGNHPGPDLVAPGGSVGSQLQGILINGATGSSGWGTSLASPHISGLIALLLHQNPGLTPNEIRTLLTKHCTTIGVESAAAQGLGLVKLV